MLLFSRHLKQIAEFRGIGDTWDAFRESPEFAVVCLVFMLYNPRDTQILLCVR